MPEGLDPGDEELHRFIEQGKNIEGWAQLGEGLAKLYRGMIDNGMPEEIAMHLTDRAMGAIIYSHLPKDEDEAEAEDEGDA